MHQILINRLTNNWPEKSTPTSLCPGASVEAEKGESSGGAAERGESAVEKGESASDRGKQAGVEAESGESAAEEGEPTAEKQRKVNDDIAQLQ